MDAGIGVETEGCRADGGRELQNEAFKVGDRLGAGTSIEGVVHADRESGIGIIDHEVDAVMCAHKTAGGVAKAVNAVAVPRIVESGQIADDLWGSRL